MNRLVAVVVSSVGLAMSSRVRQQHGDQPYWARSRTTKPDCDPQSSHCGRPRASIARNGLPVPNPRDVTNAECPEIGCIEKVDTDTVSIMKFPSSGRAEIYAASTHNVFQIVDVAADRDHPAVRTAGRIGVGLDVQHHQTLSTANVGIAGDVEDVHALHAEQLIGPSTPRRARTTRTVTHARPSLDSVAWSLLILEALAPRRGPDTARRLTQAHLREPKKLGRRCREPVTGFVPAMSATKMGRISTEEKHDG